MKFLLDARPVSLQKQKTITGHFLICYIAHCCPGSFRYGFSKNSTIPKIFSISYMILKLQKYLIENT